MALFAESVFYCLSLLSHSALDNLGITHNGLNLNVQRLVHEDD